MPQRLQDRLFLLRRALGLLGILRFCLVVILPLNDAALLLYLRDVQAADLQAGMLQHIRLDFLIGSLALRHSQIQIIQIQLHFDMLLGVKFGQKNYRLHMAREDRMNVI